MLHNAVHIFVAHQERDGAGLEFIPQHDIKVQIVGIHIMFGRVFQDPGVVQFRVGLAGADQAAEEEVLRGPVSQQEILDLFPFCRISQGSQHFFRAAGQVFIRQVGNQCTADRGIRILVKVDVQSFRNGIINHPQ